jgi:fumarate reductase flavoprotein subunit
MLSTEKTHDLAIVGAGIAGMVTAVRACQLGLSVLVLEKSHADTYMCNTRLTSGVFHCALQSPSTAPQRLSDKIKSDTQGFADEALAWAIAHHSLDAIRWLQSLGVRFIKGSQHYYEFILSPPTLFHQNQNWMKKGGDLLLKNLEKQLTAPSGQLLRDRQVLSIERDSKEAFRLSCKSSQGQESWVCAKHVVLADGGFQNNTKLLSKGISKQAEKVFQRNAGASMGDGLQMALSLGACVNTYEGFYGHLLSRDAFTNEHLWPNPWLDAIASAGLLLNESGERFANEGLGGIYLANQVAKMDNPLGAYALADDTIWQERGNLNMQGPNPKLIDVGATIFKGDQLEDVARQAGMDPARLLRTVSAYNTAFQNKALSTLEPERTETKSPAYPIVKKPFYLFPVCAGVTYTMGGILTNAHAQVLDQAHAPIQGLFAVGACTGGLEGGPTTGYVGGLIKSTVMGLLAAQCIGEQRLAT